MRIKLTDKEYNAIRKWTSKTKLDNVIDIYEKNNDEDLFYDYDDDQYLTLKEGLSIMYDAISYPFQHDGLTQDEGLLIGNLFIEFKIANSISEIQWLLV